jgi:molybdate transport system substrate-binding protein
MTGEAERNARWMCSAHSCARDDGRSHKTTLMLLAGADYVGPLPGELQDYVLFSTGVLAVSKQVDAASAFQKFAAAPESAALLRKSGMEPWHGGR